MSERKPCCAAAAAAQVKHLVVGGHRIGIVQLDEILSRAAELSHQGEAAVRKELVRLVKIYNYVPPPAERDYEEALYAEYLSRTPPSPSSGSPADGGVKERVEEEG
ncbi:MAG: hypothetical protein ACUVV6_06070 [Thermoplasmatota archaeon]